MDRYASSLTRTSDASYVQNKKIDLKPIKIGNLEETIQLLKECYSDVKMNEDKNVFYSLDSCHCPPCKCGLHLIVTDAAVAATAITIFAASSAI